jgi:hypothetical protein
MKAATVAFWSAGVGGPFGQLSPAAGSSPVGAASAPATGGGVPRQGKRQHLLKAIVLGEKVWPSLTPATHLAMIEQASPEVLVGGSCSGSLP